MSLSCWIQLFAETLPKCSLLGAIAGAPPLALPQTLAYRALFESWIGELSALPPGSLLVGVLSSHTMPQSRLLEEGWTNTVIPWVEIPPREFDRCKLHSPKQTQPSTQHKRLCGMSCCIGCNLVQHNVDRIHGLCQVLVGQDWCGCDQGHSLTYWHIWVTMLRRCRIFSKEWTSIRALLIHVNLWGMTRREAATWWYYGCWNEWLFCNGGWTQFCCMMLLLCNVIF